MFKKITKQVLYLVPEEIQLNLGNFIWKNQLNIARMIAGAERKSILVNGIETIYIEIGDKTKPVFLAVPGFSDMKESYLLFGRLMSENFRCIIVDVPGFGESGKLEETYSMENYTKWFAAFIQALGIEKFHFFGNSLGGAIIGEYALTNPDTILTMTFACSAGVYIENENGFYKEYEAGKNLFEIDKEKDMETFFDRLFYKKPSIPYLYFKYFYLHYKKNKQHYAKIMSDVSKKFLLEKEYKNVKDRYSNLNKKVLVIWGRHDSLFPVSHGELMASHIKGSIFKVIEDSGHLPQVESPMKLKNEIERFIKSSH